MGLNEPSIERENLEYEVPGKRLMDPSNSEEEAATAQENEKKADARVRRMGATIWWLRFKVRSLPS